jgi:tetratricopeptide (TPR) repeat protein
LKTAASLADFFRQEQQYPRVIALFEATIPLLKKRAGEHHTDTLSSLNYLALCYRAVGNDDKALAIFRESLKIRQTHSPNAWTTFNTMSRLGELLLELGKLDEAESHLVTGCDGLLNRCKDLPFHASLRVGEAIERCIRYYERKNNAAQQDVYQKRLKQWKEKQREKSNAPQHRNEYRGLVFFKRTGIRTRLEVWPATG